MDESRKDEIKVGDIVQANPKTTEWGPSLVVVSEVKSFGIQGYTHVPRDGDAFIRLKWADIEPTGGHAVWDHKETGETEERPLSRAEQRADDEERERDWRSGK